MRHIDVTFDAGLALDIRSTPQAVRGRPQFDIALCVRGLQSAARDDDAGVPARSAPVSGEED
jgi:hypothetical protein